MVGARLDFGYRVGDGGAQANRADHRQVGQVVADVRDLVERDALLLGDLSRRPAA